MALNHLWAEINCYQCSSRNGTNPGCEDPFAPLSSNYVKACKVPKPKHVGEFPANFCVKVTGTSTTTGEVLVIRNCVLKNMESQCGAFRFEDEMLHGCVLTCNYDGCNGAVSQRAGALPAAVCAAGALLLLLRLAG
ncbi:hypothetical protein FJT64_006803 [Amphibalanus amphitrite]|uniref:Uncharacterized protein n=1 Tax=Amphibalanus amphitrite TaxID=1232801 RepID=A0A6A4VM60_AMPAM|nr:hypothetical protein FJT64_006803 [Amphibalanus amphitrite]